MTAFQMFFKGTYTGTASLSAYSRAKIAIALPCRLAYEKCQFLPGQVTHNRFIFTETHISE